MLTLYLRKKVELPTKFTQSLHGIVGFDEKSFLDIHQSGEQITSIRLNPYKTLPHSEIEILKNAVGIPWCENGFYLPQRPSFTLDPLLHAGCYYVQEPSSMFLEQIVKFVLPDHKQGAYKLLDLCAAPGGKSTHLCALFPESLLVVNEVNKLRASILIENLIKWGKENTVVTNNDSSDFNSLPGFFDLILVDAPCSGSGLFRKDEDAIEEWSVSNVEMCAKRQKKILQEIWPCIKEDGYLIYSTCSYSKEEDEEILDWILDKFQCCIVDIPVEKNWGIVISESDKHKAKGYRFFPDHLKGEGFFICCIKKTSPESFYKSKAKKFFVPDRNQKTILEDWIQKSDELGFMLLKDQVHLVPEKWAFDIGLISQTLYLKKAGIYPGSFVAKNLIPDHELSMSNMVSSKIAKESLELPSAINYLRKETPELQFTTTGWALAQYKGMNLGWMKILSNRVNNYYPKEWRILKS
ncbi:MAG: RNA methyltransferase [Bacteroidetes bacterium]|nr:MAG: RNA methyltransferase [Bacteroidota bacterium]